MRGLTPPAKDDAPGRAPRARSPAPRPRRPAPRPPSPAPRPSRTRPRPARRRRRPRGRCGTCGSRPRARSAPAAAKASRTRSARACASSASRTRRCSCCSAPPATSPTARSSRRCTSCGGPTSCRTTSRSWPSAGATTRTRRFRDGLRESLANYCGSSPSITTSCDELVPSASSTTAATSPTRQATTSLAERLDKMDEERGTRGNRLYYLATQPSAFAEIVAQLGRAGLDHERHEGGWRRVVIEKPFGRDLDSAVRLNREVGKVFRERQVYRIDHYLGKETVRNLLVFRFAQRDLRADLEPPPHRPRADHGRGVDRDREPRRVLRGDRRVARLPAEPPAPAAEPGRDGAAGDVRRRRAARREGQGPAGDPAS